MLWIFKRCIVGICLNCNHLVPNDQTVDYFASRYILKLVCYIFFWLNEWQGLENCTQAPGGAREWTCDLRLKHGSLVCFVVLASRHLVHTFWLICVRIFPFCKDISLNWISIHFEVNSTEADYHWKHCLQIRLHCKILGLRTSFCLLRGT